jgi:hypothetical protein
MKAVDRINKYLERNDHASALFLCYIYAHIRLKSLLAGKLSPPQSEAKSAALHELNDVRLSFAPTLRMCKVAGLINSTQFTDLRELKKKRDSLAHESILWREIEKTETPDIERVCKNALRFLEDTTPPT